MHGHYKKDITKELSSSIDATNKTLAAEFKEIMGRETPRVYPRAETAGGEQTKMQKLDTTLRGMETSEDGKGGQLDTALKSYQKVRDTGDAFKKIKSNFKKPDKLLGPNVG